MTEIRLILTCVGGLVCPGIIESLRRSDETIYIVGIDMQPDAIGFHFVDKSYVVPRGDSCNYISHLMKICEKEKINVIVPGSDEELLSISKARKEFDEKGIATLCSHYRIVSTSNDKASMLKFLKEKNVPVPNFYLPQNIGELEKGAEYLGYPDKPIVVKPTVARGSRGFRIIKEQFDLFGNKESYFIKLTHLVQIIKEYKEFPKIVLMEYLPGEEFSVDALADNGKAIYIVPRKRVKAIGGPSQIGKIVRNEHVKNMVEKIIEAFGFNFNVNIQLKYTKQFGGKPLVYEINPRISGTIIANEAAGVNLLYYGIKSAMGLDIPKYERIKEVKMVRYLTELFTYGDSKLSK